MLGKRFPVREEIKTIVLIWTKGAESRKIAVKPSERTATAGAESTGFLLTATEVIVLAWQIDLHLSNNASSWQWKANAITAIKKPKSDGNIIILIRVWCIIRLSRFCL